MIQILKLSVRGFKVFKAIIRINLHEVKVNTLVKRWKASSQKRSKYYKKKNQITSIELKSKNSEIKKKFTMDDLDRTWRSINRNFSIWETERKLNKQKNRASQTCETIWKGHWCPMRRGERVFEEKVTENSPNLMMNSWHIKEAQRTPKRINSKRFYSWYTIIKWSKDKDSWKHQ